MPKSTPNVDLETNVVRFRTEAPKSSLPQGFEVKALSDNIHEVWLHGEVGWDIIAKDFYEQVGPYRAAGNKLRFRGNSPGGDVAEGYAIGNWILEAEADTEFYVDGFIGSIMTYIAACCDRTIMPKNSNQIVHRPSGMMFGTAEAMAAQSAALTKIAEQMLAIYEAKQKRTLGETEAAESIRDIMWADEDVLLTSDECAALGLADEIVDEVKMVACVRSDIVSMFNAVIPEELIVSDDAPSDPQEPSGETQGDENKDDPTVSDDPSDPAEPDDLPEEAQAEIRAACKAFDMDDRAEGFISAKASFADVKKALWKARVAADEKIETDPTPPVIETPEEDAYPGQRADKLNQQYAAKLQ